MLKKLTSSDLALHIFLFFVLIHLLLLNINVAEWGDSYRILRASEFVRNFSYPAGEKRQPLFSVLLAIRPEAVDQVLWGRLIMLGISVASFLVFRKVVGQYKLSLKQQNLALVIFALNPVYLYWSIRIMADVPFTLLVLLSFLFFNERKESGKPVHLVLSGFMVGLSSLTRFEGYILGFSLGLDLLLSKDKERFKSLFIFGFTSVLTILPWFLYRNPLTSSYFEEPSGRSYDLTTLWIYAVSLFFVFGFTSAFFFFTKTRRQISHFLRQNTALAVFLVMELILALAWPAAIPRLFIPIVPFLAILLSLSVAEFFEQRKAGIHGLAITFGLLAFFILSQSLLRLQFLILVKWILVFVAVLQVLNIISIYKKNYTLFLTTLFFSMMLWSLATIYIHKDIFRVIQDANVYILQNLKGTVAYNDVSSVSDWYLNQKDTADEVNGFYLNLDDKKGRSLEPLRAKSPDYLLITNEHNPTLEFEANEVGYLELVREFRYTIRGTEFFTKIVKVSYDN